MNNDKKYRLLDEGENAVKGDEIFTRHNGWIMLNNEWTGGIFVTPVRRLDDGKGKYVLTADRAGTESWNWGVGLWVDVFQWVREEDFNTIWRKAREVAVSKKPEISFRVNFHSKDGLRMEKSIYLDFDAQGMVMRFDSVEEIEETAKQFERIAKEIRENC